MEKQRIEELEKLGKEYSTVLDQISIFEELKENLRNQIILSFNHNFGHQGSTYQLDSGGLQYVIQVRTEADADGIKKVLPQEQWQMVKKESVDVTKLLNAIKLGVIDPIAVNDSIKNLEVEKVCLKAAKK